MDETNIIGFLRLLSFMAIVLFMATTLLETSLWIRRTLLGLVVVPAIVSTFLADGAAIGLVAVAGCIVFPFVVAAVAYAIELVILRRTEREYGPTGLNVSYEPSKVLKVIWG